MQATGGAADGAAAVAALTLAAASSRRAAGAVQAERDAAAATSAAAALRVEVTQLRAALTASQQDAHALALIVRRVFQLRDWQGYDPSLRALVDRALSVPTTPDRARAAAPSPRSESDRPAAAITTQPTTDQEA